MLAPEDCLAVSKIFLVFGMTGGFLSQSGEFCIMRLLILGKHSILNNFLDIVSVGEGMSNVQDTKFPLLACLVTPA